MVCCKTDIIFEKPTNCTTYRRTTYRYHHPRHGFVRCGFSSILKSPTASCRCWTRRTSALEANLGLGIGLLIAMEVKDLSRVALKRVRAQTSDLHQMGLMCLVLILYLLLSLCAAMVIGLFLKSYSYHEIFESQVTPDVDYRSRKIRCSHAFASKISAPGLGGGRGMLYVSHRRPSWRHDGLSWSHLGVILGLSWDRLGHLGPCSGILGQSWKLKMEASWGHNRGLGGKARQD
jgi:hypothetical protein